LPASTGPQPLHHSPYTPALTCAVRRYIMKPLLHEGFKTHIRAYMCCFCGPSGTLLLPSSDGRIHAATVYSTNSGFSMRLFPRARIFRAAGTIHLRRAATSTNHLFCYRTFHTRRLVEQTYSRQVIATQRTNRAFWSSWPLSFNCVAPQLHVVYSNLSDSATATLRLGLYISPMSLILRKMSCST
jgi:hypothetical protein